MIKVVFDTVVFVRSLINPYSHWGKVIFEYSSVYQLFVSKPVLMEILEVIGRPELTRKFSTLKDKSTKRIIEILSEAEAVDTSYVPKVSRDLKDNKFLATANKAGAGYLITEDEDLLVLKKFARVKIINTKTFLQVLER